MKKRIKNSAADESKWPASRPGFFTLGETSRTHCIGNWVGSTASLGAVMKRKISISGDHVPVVQTVA
jgi:hypothetical protein